jgi:hypothetical protein
MPPRSSAFVALVLVRGAAWAVMLPTAVATVLRALHGRPFEAGVAALAVGCGATLVASRSALHRSRAAESFAPARFRSWFLASATASAAAATWLAFVTFVGAKLGQPTATAVFGFVTACVLASAIGLLRMRAWGVLVGALTSAALGVAAIAAGGPWALGLGLTAVPGAMMALGVALARLAPPRDVVATASSARALGVEAPAPRVSAAPRVHPRLRVAAAAVVGATRRPAAAETDDAAGTAHLASAGRSRAV